MDALDAPPVHPAERREFDVFVASPWLPAGVPHQIGPKAVGMGPLMTAEHRDFGAID
ncbi:hypothetical protein [Candidatus Poriferisodalis sp.]|uniref:hypothetical protein n=1 Tax=Candidatus Poriferisodalis sp. TaxID=3101277 RepID=UPI003C6F0227